MIVLLGSTCLTLEVATVQPQLIIVLIKQIFVFPDKQSPVFMHTLQIFKLQQINFDVYETVKEPNTSVATLSLKTESSL